jgi:hypothetical protein
MRIIRPGLIAALALAAAAGFTPGYNDPNPDVPDLPVLRSFRDLGDIYDVGFSADGRVLLVQTSEGPRLVDLATGKWRNGFDPKVGAKQLGVHRFGLKGALSPDGGIVALDRRQDGGTYLVALDADSGKLLQKFYRDGKLIWFVFSPDSAALLAGYDDGAVTRWDMATGKAAWESLPPPGGKGGGTWRGAYAPDGKTVAVDFSEGPVRLLDAASGEEIAKLPWPGSPHQCDALTYSPDSRFLAISGEGLRIWDVASAKVKRSLPVGGDMIGFSPDGRTLVVWYHDNHGNPPVQLFEAASGKLRRKIAFPKGACARTSAAEPTVALATNGGVVYVCDWRADGSERPARLGPGAAQGFWDDLASDDAAAAWRAVLALAAAPEQAADLLGAHLRPQEPVPARLLERLTAQLDNDTFEDREDATRRLAALGDAAGPALRRLLASHPSAEQRCRAEDLLSRLERPLGSEEIRQVRAVEALEYAGSAEARKLLKEWAGGAEGVLLTEEARAALRRLQRKPTHMEP